MDVKSMCGDHLSGSDGKLSPRDLILRGSGASVFPPTSSASLVSTAPGLALTESRLSAFTTIHPSPGIRPPALGAAGDIDLPGLHLPPPPRSLGGAVDGLRGPQSTGIHVFPAPMFGSFSELSVAPGLPGVCEYIYMMRI